MPAGTHQKNREHYTSELKYLILPDRENSMIGESLLMFMVDCIVCKKIKNKTGLMSKMYLSYLLIFFIIVYLLFIYF